MSGLWLNPTYLMLIALLKKRAEPTVESGLVILSLWLNPTYLMPIALQKRGGEHTVEEGVVILSLWLNPTYLMRLKSLKNKFITTYF